MCTDNVTNNIFILWKRVLLVRCLLYTHWETVKRYGRVNSICRYQQHYGNISHIKFTELEMWPVTLRSKLTELTARTTNNRKVLFLGH